MDSVETLVVDLMTVAEGEEAVIDLMIVAEGEEEVIGLIDVVEEVVETMVHEEDFKTGTRNVGDSQTVRGMRNLRRRNPSLRRILSQICSSRKHVQWKKIFSRSPLSSKRTICSSHHQRNTLIIFWYRPKRKAKHLLLCPIQNLFLSLLMIL